ncbi:MAG: exonuclease domain-containing protein [Angustibacter sp.]
MDCETTGVDPLADRIVQCALAPSAGAARQWLINPGVDIPAGASQVHGLTTEFVVAHGLPPRQAFAEIAAELARYSRAGLVVFNAPFDLPLLRAEFNRHGLEQPAWDDLLIVDPMVLLWGLHERQTMRQSAACELYGIDPGAAHEALSDASAALALAQAVGACHEEVAQLTAPELMARQLHWWQQKAADWNVYASRVGRSLDDPHAWPLPAVVRGT